jgi:DNA primase
LDRDWIDELLQKVELTALIGRYLPLTRKGRTLWGCCPFHHEKDPSFAVNQDRQFYHCFGCKESGNAITFIQKMESVDFLDAVRILADDVNYTLPEFKLDKEAQVTREKRERLYALLKDAAKHYHENLKNDRTGRAAGYLAARGLDDRLVTKFGLGLSLGGGEMIAHLESLGYKKQEMKDAGLIEQRADSWYDVFYGRLIFPIIDNFSQVTGFGGRLINLESHIAVKYRNTSATPVFDKSKSLYAVNLLKKRKQRGPIPYVIIAEGYMDVIALHKAGFDTAVASMGTSLTQQQAKILKNYAETVYISYDGDGAGQTATLRGLDILSKAGLNVKVVTIPDGKDPDDLIKERGADAYRALLDGARTLTAFKIDTLAAKYDFKDPDQKAKFAVEAVKVVKALENPVEREEYLKIVQRHTGYSDEALRRQADMTAAPASAADPAPVFLPDAPKETTPKAELFIVAALLHEQPYASADEDIYPYLTDRVAQEAYRYYIDRFKAGRPISLPALFSALSEGEADSIAGYEFVPGDDEKKFKTLVSSLKQNHLLREIDRLSKEYETSRDVSIVGEIGRIQRELSRLKAGGE